MKKYLEKLAEVLLKTAVCCHFACAASSKKHAATGTDRGDTLCPFYWEIRYALCLVTVVQITTQTAMQIKYFILLPNNPDWFEPGAYAGADRC